MISQSSESILNIVVPMAGEGRRFKDASYSNPKPLIDVLGKEMIQRVIDNLTPKQNHHFIFLCQKEHILQYQIDKKLRSWTKSCDIIQVNDVTEGAALTVLLAKELISNHNPLVIANCDQFIKTDINNFLSDAKKSDVLIITMKATGTKWSYAKTNSEGLVTQVAEKKVISKEATVGIYYFRTGSLFVDAAYAMIANNDRVNNEFYVAPVYNYLCHDHTVQTYSIGNVNEHMFGIGTPEDLEFFLTSHVDDTTL
jgi:NDP-sugar pyrophosphorylase family protein